MHTEPSPKANYGSGSVPTCIGSVAGAEARGRLRTCLARLLLRGSSGGARAVLEEPHQNGSGSSGGAPQEEPCQTPSKIVFGFLEKLRLFVGESKQTVGKHLYA